MRTLALFAPAALSLSLPLPAQVPEAWLKKQLPSLVALYKELHQHPELSFREKETSRRLAAALREAGCEVTTGIGGYGLVGILQNGPGRTILVRGDMDALPVGEETGLPYRSKIYTKGPDGQSAGIMHACGHDIHMTNLVGTARFFAAHKQLWKGKLIFLGQPAEERSGGAKAMLGDGLYQRFGKPDACLALHVSHFMETGKVGLKAGPAMANVDSVDIYLFGRGGHGAAPHLCIDPVVQGAQLVLQVQTIVAREIDPIEPAVITVGKIAAGAKHNIISDRCHLQLTVRSYSKQVRAHLKAAIVRKAKAVAAAAGAPTPKVEFSEGTPALVNDPALTARATEVLRAALGAANVLQVAPVMTAEDFARYAQGGVPILMFRLGTVRPDRMAAYRKAGKLPPSVHSPFYYPDPHESLHTGVRAMACLVLDQLRR